MRWVCCCCCDLASGRCAKYRATRHAAGDTKQLLKTRGGCNHESWFLSTSFSMPKPCRLAAARRAPKPSFNPAGRPAGQHPRLKTSTVVSWLQNHFVIHTARTLIGNHHSSSITISALLQNRNFLWPHQDSLLGTTGHCRSNISRAQLHTALHKSLHVLQGVII